MNNTCRSIFAAAYAVSVAGAVYAGSSSDWWGDSHVQAELRMNIKEDTEVVNIQRDIADPNVHTKAYVLKHADPYELRSYLEMIVKTRRVDSSKTTVQALKYNDGTGVLLVSAEDYRFKDNTVNGQKFDDIIEQLDRPGVNFATGQAIYVYNPKNRSAEELLDMVKVVGAYPDLDAEDPANDTRELVLGGSDALCVDPGLNLLFFNTTNFSRRSIEKMLAEYDRPAPEVRARITVYELFAENDAKLGLDFQAWKNNDGIDLFHVGGRYMQNADAAGLVRGGGWNDTQYLNFNPKWNTKYVDFLVSKGKARQVHSCEVVARTNTSACVDQYTQVFTPLAAPIEDGSFKERYVYLECVRPGDVEIFADGRPVEFKVNDGGANITVVQLADGSNETVPLNNRSSRYILRIKGGTFIADGKSTGHSMVADTAAVFDKTGAVMPFSDNTPLTTSKGRTVETAASDKIGFHLKLSPLVSKEATKINISVSNDSLIGYTDDGHARIQKGASVRSDFMIANNGTRLVIGGIEKRDVVRVSGGVPWLKDLPVIGWVFSTENESTKRSQLLVVADVMPIRHGEELRPDIEKVKSDLQDAGESNRFGFRQLWLDEDRLK